MGPPAPWMDYIPYTQIVGRLLMGRETLWKNCEMSEILFFLSPFPLLFPFPNFCLLCSPHVPSQNPRPVPASTPPSAVSRSPLVVTVVCTGVPPICIGILTSDLGAKAAVRACRCWGTGKEAGRGRDTKTVHFIPVCLESR